MRVTYYLVAGFPLTVRDYYQRTRRLLDNIDDLGREVLPANRDIVNRFTGSYVVLTVHAFMAGIWGCPVDPPPSGLFERFEEYVETEERSMFTVLSELKYNLDASNTVNMVLGTHHPEKVRASPDTRDLSLISQSQRLLPIFHVLLRRAYQIVNLARTVPLHAGELNIIENSLENLIDEIYPRMHDLEGAPIEVFLQRVVSHRTE